MLINDLWYLIAISIIGAFLLVWLFFAIYRGIRFEMLQILGYILVVLSLSFSVGTYIINNYFIIIANILSYIGLIFTFLGLVTSNRRWIIRKGIKGLNKFSNLMLYAYIRHPITLGMIFISLSAIFLNHSILSNLFDVMAILCFILSSVEKDLYYENMYGFPYTLYMNRVPRFNIIAGIIRSLKSTEEESETKN